MTEISEDHVRCEGRTLSNVHLLRPVVICAGETGFSHTFLHMFSNDVLEQLSHIDVYVHFTQATYILLRLGI